MAVVAPSPVALTDLQVGQTGHLHEAALDAQSVNLLRALGLSPSEAFRLCKAGEPCIVQVGATRIGVSSVVAARLYVIPDQPAAS